MLEKDLLSSVQILLLLSATKTSLKMPMEIANNAVQPVILVVLLQHPAPDVQQVLSWTTHSKYAFLWLSSIVNPDFTFYLRKEVQCAYHVMNLARIAVDQQTRIVNIACILSLSSTSTPKVPKHLLVSTIALQDSLPIIYL